MKYKLPPFILRNCGIKVSAMTTNLIGAGVISICIALTSSAVQAQTAKEQIVFSKPMASSQTLVVTRQRPSLNPKFTFPARALNRDNDDVFYPLTGTTKMERTRSGIMREVPAPMDTSSNVFEQLQISWQVKTLGSWSQVAYTTNKLYRTWKESVASPLYLTVVDAACRNTHGERGAQTIADKILYGVFGNTTVPAAGDSSAVGMRFWGSYSTPNAPEAIQGSDFLCAHKDGRCGQWVKFAVDVLKAQGQEVAAPFQIGVLYPPKPSSYFRGVSWDGGTPTGFLNPDTNNPFVNVLEVLTRDAQGGVARYDYFTNHAVIVKPFPNRRGGTEYKVYDPSYGKAGFETRNAWERASIKQFAWYRPSSGTNWFPLEGSRIESRIQPNIPDVLQTLWKYVPPTPRGEQP